MSHSVEPPPPTPLASKRAVLYLQLALESVDTGRREFYLGKCLSTTADVIGIESLLNAIHIAAEFHL